LEPTTNPKTPATGDSSGAMADATNQAENGKYGTVFATATGWTCVPPSSAATAAYQYHYAKADETDPGRHAENTTATARNIGPANSTQFTTVNKTEVWETSATADWANSTTVKKTEVQKKKKKEEISETADWANSTTVKKTEGQKNKKEKLVKRQIGQIPQPKQIQRQRRFNEKGRKN